MTFPRNFRRTFLCRRIALGMLAGACLGGNARAEDTPPAAAAPRARGYDVSKTATGGALVRLDGEPIAEYIVDRANKPFLWRILGPTGKPMTRSFPMEYVPGETTDHVHQRGLAFGHHDIGGFDTWAEDASYRDHPKSSALVDIDLVAAYGPVTLADKKDAGVSIRVPDSMTVDRRAGGTTVTSGGHRDAEAWAKRAARVDYHGPVAGEHLGIAILNHPTSFRHPTPWHVRTYGLFCANPFGMRELDPTAENGAASLAAGERISLRHRFIFHVGDEQEARIAAAYDAYAAEQPTPLRP